MTVTLVSYNRPLTREARRALQDYGVESTEDVNELGHWTEVEVREEPPADVLERHELRVERDPGRVYETDHGERVLIYEDQVIADGAETTMDPADAIDHAESEGWDRIDD